MSATREFTQRECAHVFAAIPLIASLDRDGAKAIVDALLRNCQDNEHVARTLRRFSESATDWKNPVAELVAIARESEMSGEAPAGCDRCSLGEDPETGEMRWEYFVRTRIKGQYEFSGRCSCPRGRWFAELDRRRRDEARDKREKLMGRAS